MKFDNQLRYGNTIITSYQGEMPLHSWLKNFFREHKQMGSKDRRLLSNMVYGFYRLGHALRDLPTDERILLGLFLCNEAPIELLAYFRPHWNEQITLSLEEKINRCWQSGITFEPSEIFPWKEELSEGIDHTAYCLSFLRQPDLFLRIRPGYEQAVMDKLAGANPIQGTAATGGAKKDGVTTGGAAIKVAYEFIPPFTLRLPNGYKVEEWFTPDKEVVIQDYSSQRIAPFLQMPPSAASPVRGDRTSDAPGMPAATPDLPATSGIMAPAAAPRFWDACAASGGKSILAFDLNPGIDITVSDIRESILHNLRERFRRAGIKNYHSFVADLAGSRTSGGPGAEAGIGPQGGAAGDRTARLYDMILTDVPCSGSGTWSRTPEELYFFDPKKIDYYSTIQKKIVTAILPRLAKGASLVYSTCSVFKKENEEMIAFIRETTGLRPDCLELIKGYDQKADSMFAARFIA